MKVAPSISTYGGVFLARCVALVGPLGTAIITARMLGPEDRGRYYYVITLATLGAQLASLGIHASNSFLVAQQPDLLPRLLANMVWIALVGGVTAASGVVVFDLAYEGSLSWQLLGIVLVLCPLTLLFLYLSNMAVAINRSQLFNGLIIFSSIASLLAVIAAGYISPKVSSFLVATVLAALLTCVVSWWLVARDCVVPWSFDWSLLTQGIAFAARAHVAALVGFLMARTSIMILRQDGAFSDVGQWSIAAQIVDALFLLPATVSLLLFPALVRAQLGDRWAEFISVTLRLGAVMAVVCLVAGILARPAINLVFGAAYDPAVGITLALLPGVLFLSITGVISQFLSTFGIPWMQVAAWLVSWVLQIVFSLVVLKQYGVLGLAWVQSACAGVVLIWLSIMAWSYSPNRLQPL